MTTTPTVKPPPSDMLTAPATIKPHDLTLVMHEAVRRIEDRYMFPELLAADNDRIVVRLTLADLERLAGRR